MKIGKLDTAALGRPIVVAAMSANHLGRLERALEIIDAAAGSGADAVKIQTYRADTITIRSDRPEFRIHGGLWDGRSLYELYEEGTTPWEWIPALIERGRKNGLEVFSSPFDASAAALLEKNGVPAFKVASFELVDLGLVRAVSQYKKPVIMSDGLASLSEIDRAVNAARQGGASHVAVLHCVSSYPADPKDYHLSDIPFLKEHFGGTVSVGLSDHTRGTDVAVAATALGAELIEKHFTLRRSDGGLDAALSLEPQEFRALRRGVETAAAANGSVHFRRDDEVLPGRKCRRALYLVKSVKKGEKATLENIRSIRPAAGLEPALLESLLGRTFSADFAGGVPLSLSMFD